MINIAGGRTATVLAPQIDAVAGRISALNTAIANSAVIQGGMLTIRDDVLGKTVDESIRALTVAESAAVFAAMIVVLQGRLDTMNASLAAL